MLRGSTYLKGNFQGSLKELQLRRTCVPVEHRRPLGRMYRVRHPLTEIRHVPLEHWVPVWFLPPVTRAVVAENCALACGFLKFSSYSILAFFFRCSFASETVPLLQQPLISIALPFYLFFHWRPPPLIIAPLHLFPPRSLFTPRQLKHF